MVERQRALLSVAGRSAKRANAEMDDGAAGGVCARTYVCALQQKKKGRANGRVRCCGLE